MAAKTKPPPRRNPKSRRETQARNVGQDVATFLETSGLGSYLHDMADLTERQIVALESIARTLESANDASEHDRNCDGDGPTVQVIPAVFPPAAPVDPLS